MKQIPVNIISGFLGSGKTTAIIRLLNQKQKDERWAIIVNEFGKISIDGQTLQSKSTFGSVFDISGGCICCSAKGYLHENLKKIIQAGSFDRIIIEPSGLGGIEMVSEIVETLTELKMRPAICLVDITTISNKRLQQNMIYRAQIARAGIIAFSKCDLLTGIEFQDEPLKNFKTLFPEKKYCLSVLSLTSAHLEMDFSETHSTGSSVYFASDKGLNNRNYQEMYFQYTTGTVIDREKLVAFLADCQQVFRAKGHILTKNGWKLFNFTLSGSTFEDCTPKAKNELVIVTKMTDNHLFTNFREAIEKICTDT
jgi:G3E family GTPase